MIIIGAKGFAIQLYDVLVRLGSIENLFFFDDIEQDNNKKFLGKFPIIKNEQQVRDLFKNTSDKRFVLGVGGPTIRKCLYERFVKIGGEPYTIISKDAIIGNAYQSIGKGSCVLSNSILESTTIIGDGTLINLNVIVTHNTKIGNFCELSPGVRISGGCEIGNNVFIGTGAIILPKIKIGNNAVIGAGSVVTKNIEEEATVVGVPAKPFKK